MMVAGLTTAVALGGCNGSGDPKSGSAESSTPTSAGSATTIPAPSTGRLVRLFCQSTKTLNGRVTAAALSMGEDPAQVRTFVDELRAASQEVANTAPTEIAPDIRVITDSVEAFAGSLEQAGYDPAKAPDDAAAALAGPEVQAASQRVEGYINARCPTDS